MTTYTHRPEVCFTFGWEFLFIESRDPVRQVACQLLFPDGRIYFGWNHIHGLSSLTGTVADYIWKENRPLGRILAAHAEAEAIRKAVLDGVTDFSQSTLIVSLEPCEKCRELIEIAGIPEVYFGEKYVPRT